MVLGASSIGIAPGTAYARPSEPEGNTNCRLETAGSTILYPPGTVITVTLPDGTKQKYRCNGTTGEWEETKRGQPVVVIPGAVMPGGSMSLR
jgi:hypothetical protein